MGRQGPGTSALSVERASGFAVVMDYVSGTATDDPRQRSAEVDLYWIPLGAGQHVVRLSGRLFEAISACAATPVV